MLSVFVIQDYFVQLHKLVDSSETAPPQWTLNECKWPVLEYMGILQEDSRITYELTASFNGTYFRNKDKDSLFL